MPLVSSPDGELLKEISMDVTVCGVTLNEHEQELFRKRMDETEPYKGMDVYFCFPEKLDLETIKVVGTVPRVGESISCRAYGINPDPEYDFRDRFRFRVKEVIYSVTVQTTSKERLLFPHRMRAEVYLVPDRWFEFKCEMRHWRWRIVRFLRKVYGIN